MEAKYDIQVWQQAVEAMRTANVTMRKRINEQHINGYVIVSNTFDHCVGSDENQCATAEVIAFSTQPVVLQRKNAERLASSFKAYCGRDERRIYWQVMDATEYYKRLIQRNESSIELLQETLAKHGVTA